MTKAQAKILVDTLGCSHRVTNQNKADIIKLSLLGYIEREEVSIMGMACQRISLTNKGVIKAKQLHLALTFPGP